MLLCLFRHINLYSGTNILFNRIVTVYRTRGTNNNLACQPFRTTLFKNCIMYVGPQLWNALPQNIKEDLDTISLNVFKKRIKTHLFTLQTIET